MKTVTVVLKFKGIEDNYYKYQLFVFLKDDRVEVYTKVWKKPVKKRLTYKIMKSIGAQSVTFNKQGGIDYYNRVKSGEFGGVNIKVL